MKRGKPYPHVTIGGQAASDILSLATRWMVTPEEVVTRLLGHMSVTIAEAELLTVGLSMPPKAGPG